MKKTLYFFSGLGADERAFHRLDLSGYSVVFIRWISPEKGETIESYASRLLEQITTPNPVLIGLSFGGMMAVEVAKQISTEKVILIASAKTKKEIPLYYRLAGKIYLHRLLPAKVLKWPNVLAYWFFGVTAAEDKLILAQILNDTDPHFLKWAIGKVARWRNTTELFNIKHIHGTADRVLPFQFVNSDVAIYNGGHLMTLNKAAEINQQIKAILKAD
ncbi:MAG: alpha/beta hydrolase [Sphingobacteriaceae bacterium]|nr:MAG: alpha/beta hydrolase [Sphingobacteriaceae bacterium]